MASPAGSGPGGDRARWPRTERRSILAGAMAGPTDGNRPDEDGVEGDGAVATETTKKVQRPRLYKVLLHNDDYTTMEFVVMVLMTVFHHAEPDAVQIMLNVHKKGIGVAGV